MRTVLDACVLYPTAMRAILLQVAAVGLFTPLWSPRILEEWARAARKEGETGEMQARAEIALLRANWPGAEVSPPDGLPDRLWLPDPADTHVLAAAVATGASAIVTLNARDFPRRALAAEGIARHDPDALLRTLWQEAPSSVEQAVHSAHSEAVRTAGAPAALRPFLKRAGLPRLGRALAASPA